MSLGCCCEDIVMVDVLVMESWCYHAVLVMSMGCYWTVMVMHGDIIAMLLVCHGYYCSEHKMPSTLYDMHLALVSR